MDDGTLIAQSGVDFSQGVTKTTKRSLDLAIEGNGFFMVKTPQGTQATRDGRFQIGTNGQLQALDGATLMGKNNLPIQIDPAGGPVQVGTDGTVQQGETTAGQIDLQAFANPGSLQRAGANRFIPSGPQAAVTATRHPGRPGAEQRGRRLLHDRHDPAQPALRNEHEGGLHGHQRYGRQEHFRHFHRPLSRIEEPAMMRAMWSAAAGMNVQTMNMDAISNNLANINTAGFKSARAEFQDLLYQTINTAGTSTSTTTTQPVSIQLGHGARLSAMVKDFSTGSLQQTNSPLDLAIQGEGFFQVTQTDGTIAYTRDGSFTLDQNGNVVNASGNTLSPQITIPQDALTITIATDGTVTVTQPGQTNAPAGGPDHPVELHQPQRPQLHRQQPAAADPGQRRSHHRRAPARSGWAPSSSPPWKGPTWTWPPKW